jgi:LPS-assembly lipoprotein
MIKRNLLVIGLAVALSACGFQLRGTGTTKIALTDISLTARDAYGYTIKELTRSLEQSGVKVHAGAPYQLNLVNEAETQRATSYASTSRTSDYELTTKVDYQLIGHEKRVLLQDSAEVNGEITHDGSNLAGSQSATDQVRGEMRRQLVQNLMLRLQQMTPARLDELQAKADARAMAEQDAADEAKRIEDATPQQSPLEVPAK